MPIELLWFIAVPASVVAATIASLRWLRIGQREHYIPGSVFPMVLLWLSRHPINIVAVALVLTLIPIGIFPEFQFVLFAALAVLAFVPFGLSVRGRTSTLAWTVRLKRLAGVLGLLLVIVGTLMSFLAGPAGLGLTVLLAAPLTDLALRILWPIEKRLSRKYLVSARKRLQQVRPRIVAITGSYGKTSTKGYVAHLLADSFSVVASPASFNNLMGLSRAVNERVVAGTEVFVAEMGIHAPGQIRELSESFPPDIAAITVIGEAHIASLKSKDVIFRAKAEITEKARIVVLPIDQPELAGLAERCRTEGKVVVTVSTNPDSGADVIVDAAREIVTVREGKALATAPVAVSNLGHAVNVAVAVGIAHALDVPLAAFAQRLASVPEARHRAEVQETSSGVLIVDDTYNSNPVGSDRAVRGAALLAAERGGPLVVVTPGMVELGHVQVERNEALGSAVAEVGGHLFAIARTNRAALVAGGAPGPHPVRTFERREQAVAAALDQAGDRGVILYENDLPDHYP
jgi:UDP-N-acetylmuramoyl-tripeptide--D-alanyl-D-alanine ligase